MTHFLEYRALATPLRVPVSDDNASQIDQTSPNALQPPSTYADPQVVNTFRDLQLTASLGPEIRIRGKG